MQEKIEPEYISLNEYCRRFRMGKPQVKYMCEQGQLDYRITPSGYYKIKVGGDTVSTGVYENVMRENEKLKTLAKSAISILNEILV